MPVQRLTFSANQLIIRANILEAQQRFNKASAVVGTGQKISTLSDSPADISRLLNLRTQSNENDQFQRNINLARLKLEYNDSRFEQSTNVLNEMRDIALTANNSTLGPATRTELASRLTNLKEEFLSYANSKLDGKYIFSGTQTDTEPFNGTPTVYNGDSTIISVRATGTLSIKTNIDPVNTFLGNVDTAVGSDTVTTLKNSDGVNLDIAAGDTITVAGTIGSAFSSTISITSSTTLSNLASSLQTIIRANGVGTETVSVTAGGALQITAGTTAISGLNMSISGKTVFNTAMTFTTPIAISGTGTSDTLLNGDGEDIFDVIDDTISAVQGGDPTEISTHLARIDTALSQMNDARAVVGGRLQQIDSLEDLITAERVRLLSSLSDVQDADIDDALTKLATAETALKLVFSSSSKVLETLNSLSLQN